METYAEDDVPSVDQAAARQPDLIAHVAVGKMNIHNQAALEPAIEDVSQRGLKPTVLLADSHYGSTECLEKGQKHAVTLISPAMTAKGKCQGKLTLEDFELAEDGRILRCPEGHAPLETSVVEVRLQVLLDATRCAACPQRERCPLAAMGRTSQRCQYTHDRVHQRQRRLADASEKFRQRYRWRAGV